MDWRISIRGIWDIQGRNKGKKKKHPPPSNGWWIITSRERKKERKSRWMKVNISPSCFFSWIDKGSAERSRHLRAFGLEKTERNQIHKGETMMYRFEQQRKMGGSAQLSAHDLHKGLSIDPVSLDCQSKVVQLPYWPTQSKTLPHSTHSLAGRFQSDNLMPFAQ
jgi:hypothetical protein